MDEITPFIEQLSHDDFSVRRMAAEVLGQMGDERAIPPLLVTLRDEEWQVRNTAIEALSCLNSDAVLRELLPFLESEDANMRNGALSALQYIGSDAVPPLIESLRSQNPERQIFSANALGFIGDALATKPLLEVLENPSTDENARYAIVEALGRIGCNDATPVLAKHLHDAQVWDKAVFIDALGAIGDERAVFSLVESLKNEEVREFSIHALGRIASPLSVDALLDCFEEKDEEVCAASLFALYRVREKIMSSYALTGFLFPYLYFSEKFPTLDPEHLVRCCCKVINDNAGALVVDAQGDSGDEEEKEELVRAAVSLLKVSSQPLPLEVLSTLLQNEGFLEDAMTLFHNVHAEQVTTLFRNAEHCREEYLSNLFDFVTVLRVDVPEEIVLQGLEHPSNDVVYAACLYSGLLNRGTPRVVKQLSVLAEEGAAKVQAAASGAFLMMFGSAFMENIQHFYKAESGALRAIAIRYIGFNGVTSEYEKVFFAMNDPEINVREAAILSLGDIARRQSFEKAENDDILERLFLSLHEDSGKLQQRVIAVLERFPAECVLSQLLGSYSEEFFSARLEVIRYCSKHSSEESVAFLLKLLEESKPEVTITALNALTCTPDNLKNKEILPLLVSKLTKTDDSDILAAFLECIGSFVTPEDTWVVASLKKYLSSDSWMLKLQALKVLGRFETEEGVKLLLEHFSEITPFTTEHYPLFLEAVMRIAEKKPSLLFLPLAKQCIEEEVFLQESMHLLTGIVKETPSLISTLLHEKNPLFLQLSLALAVRFGCADKDQVRRLVEQSDSPSVCQSAFEALYRLLGEEKWHNFLAFLEQNNCNKSSYATQLTVWAKIASRLYRQKCTK